MIAEGMGILSALASMDSAGNSKKAAEDTIARNRYLLNLIQSPQYKDMIAEGYSPEAAQHALIGEDPTLKSARNQSLLKLAGLAETGLSDEDQAVMEMAKNKASQMARGEREAAMSNARARGVGGGGLEFAMREMANQGSAQRAQEAGLNQAATSSRQRALYNQLYNQGLNSANDADFRNKSANAGIINQFNMANTANRNSANLYNINSRNDAFRYNENLKDKRFANEMSKATGQQNLNNQYGAVQIEGNRANAGALNGMFNTIGKMGPLLTREEDPKKKLYGGQSYTNYDDIA